MKLREIRTKKKLTLQQLSNKSGVPVSTISDIETGKVESPGVKTMEKLAKALKVKVSDLI